MLPTHLQLYIPLANYARDPGMRVSGIVRRKRCRSTLQDLRIQLRSMGSGGSVPEKVVAAEKKAASPSVAIIYYSTYGHVKKMADEIKSGDSPPILSMQAVFR